MEEDPFPLCTLKALNSACSFILVVLNYITKLQCLIFFFRSHTSNLGDLLIFSHRSKRVSNPGNSGSKLESPENFQIFRCQDLPQSFWLTWSKETAILLFLKDSQVILIRELLTKNRLTSGAPLFPLCNLSRLTLLPLASLPKSKIHQHGILWD